MMELKDIEQVKFLGTPGYETLQNAVSTIGSIPTELKVTDIFAVPNDIQTPDNIMIRRTGRGAFNIASGKHLQIMSCFPGRQKLNVGLGMLSFGKNSMREMELGLWVGDGLIVSVTATMLAGIFESFIASNGGDLVLPQATITFPGVVEFPSGAIRIRGRKSDYIYGTVVKIATDSTDFFRIKGLRSGLVLEDFAIDVRDRSAVKPFVVTEDSPRTYSHEWLLQNLHIMGGTKGVFLDGGADHGFQITGGTLNRVFFLDQSDVGLDLDSQNSGITLRDCTFNPKWNKVAGAIRNIYGGQIRYEGITTINGRNFTLGDHHASFVDADLNTSTDTINFPGGHRFTNTNALSSLEVEEVDLSNTGGAFPVLSPARTNGFVKYIDGSNITLHATAGDVLTNTNKLNFTSASGGGVHTLRAITAIWTRFVDADVNLGSGVLTARGHRVPVGTIIACAFQGADPPAGWNIETQYYFRATSLDQGTIHGDRNTAQSNTGIIIPSDVGSGVRQLCLNQPMYGERPRFGMQIGTRANQTSVNSLQDEGIPISAEILGGPGNYNTNIVFRDSILQGLILFNEANCQAAFEGCVGTFWQFTDTANSNAVVFVERMGFIPDPLGSGKGLTFNYSVIPLPGRIDAFVGNSLIKSDRRFYRNTWIGDWVRIHLGAFQSFNFPNERAFTVTSTINDQPMICFGAAEDSGSLIYVLWQWFRNGVSYTNKVGWARFATTSGVASEKGVDIIASVEIDGSFSNQKRVTLGSSGSVSMDCALTSFFDIDPTADVNITPSNMRPNHLVGLRIKSTGTTSRTITFNDPFSALATYATGTTDGIRRELFFVYDGTKLVEVGRVAAGGGSGVWGSITGTLSDQSDLITALNLKAALASPLFTGNPELSGATNSFKLKGRDGSSYVHLYSDPSGRYRVFADLGGIDLFTVDTNEFIFNSMPKIASPLNEAYNASTWNGNLALVNKDQFRDKIETLSPLELLQNSQSANYTIVLADSGKQILHPVGDNNPRTFTIPANASVAFPVGTAITFVNKINDVTIAITTDTLTLVGTGSTGPRVLAANGMATALKITSTEWLISGTGLT